jgi:hypothetical protein
MSTTIKRTISLPEDLAKETEEIARTEGKTFSAVVQDALRQIRAARLRGELRALQNYWSKLAKDKGILTEKDLERYLEN